MFRSQMIRTLLVLGASLTMVASAAAQEQHTEEANTEAPSENSMEWSLNAGGVFNSGNTRAWSLNAGTHFGFVRGRHGLTLDWVFSYGRAALRDPDTDEFGDTQDVARNSNARARYDFFISDNDVAFAAVTHRWDTFAGLDTRLQAQLGYLRFFLNEENHKAWGEIGYDFTYDNFHAEDESTLDPDDDAVHSARLYLGYNNQLRENVQFLTGLEALFDLEKTFGNGDTDDGNDGDFGENLRLTFDAGLNVTVIDSLQLGINFKLLYDEQPVVNRERVDTITTFTLVYSLI